jgi:hypothetical protein
MDGVEGFKTSGFNNCKTKTATGMAWRIVSEALKNGTTL